VERGWSLFNRLAAVAYPTLALVRGHCMGGGFELALACRYRITVDEPATRMALPEVMLGIYPAWGGMLRLPRLVGPAAALDLMLTGKGVDARKAKRLGLADDCVPPRVMDSAAASRCCRAARRAAALHAAPSERPAEGRRGPPGPPADGRQGAPRALPGALRDHRHLGPPRRQRAGGAGRSPASLEAIFRSPTAKNLVRVFYLQERLKAFGKDADFAPKRVHVVGAGVMGGDIAAECALRGMIVTLQDQSIERIAPAIARAAKRFERKLRGQPREVRFALDRLIPDPAGHGVAQADVVIEAIFENLEAKRALLADIERRAGPTR
jgi:3-hydroxyacyl-CoA dehydrogenase/enoyl-CoA hydratase/3-hydroxybutyryl-CoA epimerase